MPFYYFSLLIILVFIPLKRFKVLVVCTILTNAAFLIFLEYRDPHLVMQKLGGHKLYLYKYLHMMFVALVTIVLIQTAKKFYKTDKKTITELNKNFQDQPGSEENSIPEIYLNLTSQERKVLEHIQKGKRNKEIASVLNVDISTVKTHINNIYKKKGIRTRTDLLNIWN
jgi:DNA-binding NarL/FixJ family response regulator